MSFEEWKNKNLAKGESKTWIEWCGEAYEAGAASRQGEIDELLKRESKSNDINHFEINHIAQANQQLRLKVDELQKRINEALDHTVNHGGYDDLTHIINILKGKNNG